MASRRCRSISELKFARRRVTALDRGTLKDPTGGRRKKPRYPSTDSMAVTLEM